MQNFKIGHKIAVSSRKTQNIEGNIKINNP